jgi:hypothetical protein
MCLYLGFDLVVVFVIVVCPSQNSEQDSECELLAVCCCWLYLGFDLFVGSCWLFLVVVGICLLNL